MNKNKLLIKIFGSIGIVIGILIIAFGIIQFFWISSPGSYVNATKFGADFYTYIYQLVKDIDQTLDKQYYLTNKLLSFFVIIIGVLDICYFSFKMAIALSHTDESENKTDDNNSNKQQIENSHHITVLEKSEETEPSSDN